VSDMIDSRTRSSPRAGPLRHPAPGAGTVWPDHARQRLRPHQAEHVRPAAWSSSAAIDEALARRRGHRGRGHRQAVHLRRRRRPQGDAGGRHAGRRRRLLRRARARRSSASCATRRSRRSPSSTARHGRRPRARAALRLPHASSGVPAVASPRGLPRPGPRLGRQPAAAEPGRGRQGVKVIVENPLNQNRMLKGTAGLRPRHRRRDVRARRLPRAVAALGASRSSPASHRGPARGRPRRGLGRRPSAGARASPTRVHGATPAPYRALDLIEAARTAPYDEGFAPRTRRSSSWIMGEELRAGLYAFDLTQKRAKRPAGAPDKVAGPGGHQGRRRRRRADGLAARAAVRAAPRGAGRPHRPRPGARRQGRRLRPRRGRQAARQGPDDQDKANRLKALVTGGRPARTPSPTPTSSSRPCSRR
jgi:hypothetical protein